MNIHKSPYLEEEGGGGERRAPNKAGPCKASLNNWNSMGMHRDYRDILWTRPKI